MIPLRLIDRLLPARYDVEHHGIAHHQPAGERHRRLDLLQSEDASGTASQVLLLAQRRICDALRASVYPRVWSRRELLRERRGGALIDHPVAERVVVAVARPRRAQPNYTSPASSAASGPCSAHLVTDIATSAAARESPLPPWRGRRAQTPAHRCSRGPAEPRVSRAWPRWCRSRSRARRHATNRHVRQQRGAQAAGAALGRRQLEVSTARGSQHVGDKRLDTVGNDLLQRFGQSWLRRPSAALRIPATGGSDMGPPQDRCAREAQVAQDERATQREIDAGERRWVEAKDEGAPPQTGARDYPVPLLPGKHLEKPGREADLTPKPTYDATFYKGTSKLRDKVALITGTDSGIGRAVVVLFARECCDVAIAYLEECQDAQDTKAAVEEEGRRAILLPGDASDPEYAEAAVAKTIEALGGLDILSTTPPSTSRPRRSRTSRSTTSTGRSRPTSTAPSTSPRRPRRTSIPARRSSTPAR